MNLSQSKLSGRLVRELAEKYNISHFVETGTAHGDTANWAAQFFDRVWTVEYSESMHREAKQKFGHVKNIEFLYGDSRQELNRLSTMVGEPCLFWLDAHWCGGNVAYGLNDECPLLKEIESIRRFSGEQFIFIDDANLFLSPPPEPHQADQWPDIAAVIRKLNEHTAETYTVLVEDIIVSVPSSARQWLVQFLRASKKQNVPVPFARYFNTTSNPKRLLLDHRKNVYSQFGEDGIFERIFETLPPVHKFCCEFGAGDGISASNTRRLIEEGWTGVMIEADRDLFEKLRDTYNGQNKVHCIQGLVNGTSRRVSVLIQEAGLSNILPKIDLISIDIDGLDYEIFESLDFSPSVVSIEVNPGFPPDDQRVFDREMAKNIGQPLPVFTKIAAAKGYALVCFTPNAIFLRRDLLERSGLRELTNVEAYKSLVESWVPQMREWMFLNNLGFVYSFKLPYKYQNPYLSYDKLGLEPDRVSELLQAYFSQPWQGQIASLIQQQNSLIEQRDYWLEQARVLSKEKNELEQSLKPSFSSRFAKSLSVPMRHRLKNLLGSLLLAQEKKQTSHKK